MNHRDTDIAQRTTEFVLPDRLRRATAIIGNLRDPCYEFSDAASRLSKSTSRTQDSQKPHPGLKL